MKRKTYVLSIVSMMIVAVLWLGITSPVSADADLVASFVFGPEVTYPTNTLQVGNTFTATVRTTSTTNQPVDTWGIYINFDPTVVQVNSWSRTYPRTIDICTVPETTDNVNGRIYAECTDLGGTTTTDGLDVLEITFEVLQTDTTFDVTFDTVCDGAGNAECFQALRTGVNQIAFYNDSNNVPLAVSLQSFSADGSGVWWPMVVMMLGLMSVVFVLRIMRIERG